MAAEFIVGDNRDALLGLCRSYLVDQLELFGSSTSTEAFDPQESDLDFLVTFQPCTPSEHYDRYFGLLESRFKRNVDLAEARAMRNPYFIREVNRSRKLLYAA